MEVVEDSCKEKEEMEMMLAKYTGIEYTPVWERTG